MQNLKIGAATIALVAAMSTTASASHLDYFTAIIKPLNGSGVTGKVNLTLDPTAGMESLLVHVTASGLEKNKTHVQHIHGRLSNGLTGQPIDSFTPGPAQDTDGDTFIEVGEGVPTYGPIILPLSSPPGGAPADFPTAPDGTIDFTQLYLLNSDSIFANIPDTMTKYTKDDLLPLHLREFVVHGMTVPAGVGAGTDGEVNGTGGYLPALPVGAGAFRATDSNFNVVPLPAAGWMLLSALGGLGLLGRAARRRQA